MSRTHPILKQLQPSDEQWPAVSARGTDVVVTAGAGTGKTRTLVARGLSLLADRRPLRSVVAVTFTTKAAREMRNRLRKEIATFLDSDACADSERTFWETLSRELDAARIGTIHSLCAEILRNHPVEAGVDPRFQVLDESQAALLTVDAVTAAMAWAADDPEAARLFHTFPPSKLRQLLAALLENRLKVAELFALPWREAWTAALTEIETAVHDFVADPSVQDDFAFLRSLRANGALAQATAAGDKLADALPATYAALDGVEVAAATGDWSQVATRLSVLRMTLKQAGSKKNWPAPDPKAAIKRLQDRYDQSVDTLVPKGSSPALDRTLLDLMPQWERLFQYATDAYAAAKTAAGGLDFDDLEERALCMLRDHPDVRSRWQGEVTALLVDEFQDTNARQRDLIRLLGGNRGVVFVVGDAKQSIYRFRGAEVQVFRAERESIRQGGGTAAELTVSYRTHRDLLACLNGILRRVLGEEDDRERPWREPFYHLAHFHEEGKTGLQPPYVELHLAVGSKTEDQALEHAADALAAYLAALVHAPENRLTFGDIAVLCRGSRSFAPYENAFERHGIPFVTVAGRGFYERPEVRDLLNALQALADPSDDLALLGLLRSPAFGFSDAELYRLRAGGIGDGSLWQALEQAGDEHCRQAAALIRTLHERAGRVAVADLLKDLLAETDYRAILLAADDTRAARNVSKLLDDAHRSGLVGVGRFLEYMQNVRDVSSREGEARVTGEGVVQIMTVHAAKGLEFPLIVIGDAGAQPRSTNTLLLDDEFGLVFDARDTANLRSVIFQRVNERHVDMEEAESDRLLYVAATRAQDKLIISGHLPEKRKASGWLGQLLTAISPDGINVKHLASEHGEPLAFTFDVDTQTVACTIYPPAHVVAEPPARPVAAPSPMSTMPWEPTLVEPLAAPAPQKDEGPQRVWRVAPRETQRRAPAWVVGKLVHAGLARWRFDDDRSLRDELETQARNAGLIRDSQIRDGVLRALQFLERFRRHALFRAIDQASRRYHEVPFSVEIDGQVETGMIDLLFEAHGRWTVVEFKTDHLRTAADLEGLLEKKDYIAQLQRYGTAVSAMVGQPPELLLCFLDYCRVVKVMPVDLPAGAAPAARETPALLVAEAEEREQAAQPWQEVLNLADGACHPLLRSCRELSLPLPDVGSDIPDSRGRVLATPELSWADQRIAVFLPGAESEFLLLNQAGWRTFFATDTVSILEALKEESKL